MASWRGARAVRPHQGGGRPRARSRAPRAWDPSCRRASRGRAKFGTGYPHTHGLCAREAANVTPAGVHPPLPDRLRNSGHAHEAQDPSSAKLQRTEVEGTPMNSPFATEVRVSSFQVCTHGNVHAFALHRSKRDPPRTPPAHDRRDIGKRRADLGESGTKRRRPEGGGKPGKRRAQPAARPPPEKRPRKLRFPVGVREFGQPIHPRVRAANPQGPSPVGLSHRPHTRRSETRRIHASEA